MQVDQQVAFERHWSVEELAERWNLSTSFIRKPFLKEPGVVVFWRQLPHKRAYRTIRIPESVAVQVHRKLRQL